MTRSAVIPSLCRSRLLGMFLKDESSSDAGETSDMEHFANVMTNVTQVVEGRTFLLEPGRHAAKTSGRVDQQQTVGQPSIELIHLKRTNSEIAQEGAW